MAFEASCPACGAQVTFKSGSAVVVVCEFCNSAVARTDRGVEDLGRVADVAESGSPLDVGLGGVYRGLAFQLTGRAQLSHAAGGFWDEWYALFSDGGWGWLAEAQGRFYITFPAQPPAGLPAFDALRVGEPVPGIPARVPLVTSEKGVAQYVAAEGEIPYRLVPGEHVRYADLSGTGGDFGTIDYSEAQPLLYLGREVTLDELGLAHLSREREREARRVDAAQLNCPQCAGPLALHAPDRAERVGCPNCGSLLDVNQGRLRYLKTLERKGPQPSIPLGASAEFEGRPQTVIGFVVRSVEFEGVRYFWQEYLLYNPAVGFRWLVESDGHWSYVRPVPPGEVQANGHASYGGRSFKKFQDATARVEFVQGEFYWKVEAGELTRATDYVSPPLMLSKEVPAGKQAASEINWSLGGYVPLKEIEGKFKVDLPKPSTVAPNQPFGHKRVYGYWAALMAAAVVLGLFFIATGSRRVVFSQSYDLKPEPAAGASPSASAANALGAVPILTPGPNASAAEVRQYQQRKAQYEQAQAALAAAGGGGSIPEDNTQVIFSEPFKLRGRENVRVTAEADVENNWLYVAGDLINEETGLVQQFDLPVEQYSGVEGGESWTEGGRTESAHLSSLPEGSYTLRLEAHWEKWNKPSPPRLQVKVEQGVPRVLNLILLLLALSAVPLIVAIAHFSFEHRRWADSAFNPYDSEE